MNFFFWTKRYRLTLGIVATLFVVTGTLLFKIKSSEALGILGFGGTTMSVTICTCTEAPSFYVVIGPPKGGTFVFTETSIPHEYDNFWGAPFGSWVSNDTWVTDPAGPWVVGAYVPETVPVCWMAGEPCYSLASQGTVTQYGTSAGPATY